MHLYIDFAFVFLLGASWPTTDDRTRLFLLHHGMAMHGLYCKIVMAMWSRKSITFYYVDGVSVFHFDDSLLGRVTFYHRAPSMIYTISRLSQCVMVVLYQLFFFSLFFYSFVVVRRDRQVFVSGRFHDSREKYTFRIIRSINVSLTLIAKVKKNKNQIDFFEQNNKKIGFCNEISMKNCWSEWKEHFLSLPVFLKGL